jgi:UDP-2,3-diacylglucosamine hydrolase
MAALPEVELPPGALLVADLHLDAEADGPDVVAFVAWLEGARDSPRIAILGDLFEYWIGPAQARSAGGARVLDALAACAAAGCPVEVVPGNRDFLLGEDLTRRTGARVHPEGFVGLTPAGRLLAIHGDVLCTADRGYQRLRRVLRSWPVRALGPRLPGPLARPLARRLRRASRRAVDRKAPLDTALKAEEAVRRLSGSGCGTLVCGHAHRHRDEALEGGGRLLVLDAFGGPRDTLVVGVDGGLHPRA